MNVRELIGKRVRVVNIDNLWDKDKYNPYGMSYKPVSKYISNGDIGTIREDDRLFCGLFVEFDNGDVSQTYLFDAKSESGVQHLLDAIEVLEK